MLNRIDKMSLCRIVIFIVFVAAFSGCEALRTMDSFDGILNTKLPPDREVATLDRAESAFFQGNYMLAKNLFNEVKRQSDKTHYINQAHYGLVCISIATAEGLDDIKKALAMMNKWQKPGGDIQGYLENPKMMSVALNKKTELLNCENEVKVITAKKKTVISKEQQDEIEQLKNTIKKLEHQISVLEAIDLEIQEKRKPI
jgi:hypothetical protein